MWGVPGAFRHKRRNALDSVPERFQLWVEAVLDRDQLHAGRESRQHRRVVVALGAEQDRHAGGRLPGAEMNELGRLGRAIVHANAGVLSAFDLRRVRVHKHDPYSGRTEGVTNGTTDAAGADNVNRIHARLAGAQVPCKCNRRHGLAT